MSRQAIYLLSASDRNNYGDLLFPIVSQKELEKLGFDQICSVGIVKSNLQYFGGIPTKPYGIFYKKHLLKIKPVIFVAGGEVLEARWSVLFSYIYRFFYFIFSSIKNKEILESGIKKLYGYEENPFPFVPSDKKILKSFDIVFHSVGGVSLSLREETKRLNTFLASKYFSVRDEVTFKKVKTLYKDANPLLTPDVAILISDYYNFELEEVEKYIVFQVNNLINKTQLININNQLLELHKNTKLKIHFLPIGICPGHDDLFSLRKLKKMAEYPCKIIYPKKLTDTMKEIAFSEIFIGTSLHGTITAMSFGRRFLGLNPKTLKLKSYIETWSEPPFNIVSEFNELAKQAETLLLNDVSVIIKNTEIQKELVKKSFRNIAEKIK